QVRRGGGASASWCGQHGSRRAAAESVQPRQCIPRVERAADGGQGVSRRAQAEPIRSGRQDQLRENDSRPEGKSRAAEARSKTEPTESEKRPAERARAEQPAGQAEAGRQEPTGPESARPAAAKQGRPGQGRPAAAAGRERRSKNGGARQ